VIRSIPPAGGNLRFDRTLRVALISAAGITAAALVVTRPEGAPGPRDSQGQKPDSARAGALNGLPAAVAALDTLAETERAFSALSVKSGKKEAFLHYLGRDGLIFRRGFVNGRKSWEARNDPAGTLTWAPAYAEVAGNADLGWTMGPWEYRPPAGGADSAPAYGSFITVWARPIEWVRDEDRVWRVALDTGLSHGKPATDVERTVLEHGPAHEAVPLMRAPGVGFDVGVFSHGLGLGVGSGRSSGDVRWREMQHASGDLLQTDREYAFALRNQGAAEAIGHYAAEDLQTLREGVEPALGKMAAIEALARQPRDREFTPLGSRVSTSYDLGCSWGLFVTRSTPRDTSAYLHVWRYEPGRGWVVVADVENRFAPR